MKTKICSKCKKIKSMNSFNLCKEAKDKHNSICRLCQKIIRREYYLKHSKEARKYSLIYLKNHLKECRERTAKWRKKNRFAIFWICFKNRAKRYDIHFNITKDDFINWYTKQDKKCIYCGLTSKQLNKSRDKIINGYNNLSIDRKDNKIGYILTNIVLACMRCNNIKSDFFTFKEMIKLGKYIRKKALKLLKK